MQNSRQIPDNDKSKDIFENKFLNIKSRDKTLEKHSSDCDFKDSKNNWIDNEKIILDESRKILVHISEILGLGEVSLKNDEDDFYPPTFYIQAPSSLKPEERLITSEKIFDLLNYFFNEKGKL